MSSALCATTYTVRDLSDLPDGAYLLDLDDYGQAAGLFTGADGRSHAVRCSLQGGYTDLGLAYGVDINNYGQVLVQSPISCFISNPDGTVLDLRPLLPTQSYPQRINDLGWVAGYMLYSTGRYRGFVWSSETGTIVLPLPIGDATGFAMDVNNAGQVAGYSLNSAQSYARASIWTSASGLIPMQSAPQATYSMPARLNDAGQAIGTGTGYLGYRSVLWNPDGTVFDLGFGEASDLNSAGQVLMREFPQSYVLDADSSRSDLPGPEGAMGVMAYGINNRGVVVGKIILGTGVARATVWEPKADAIKAVIDIQPNVINARSKGKGFLNCFIELPADGPAAVEEIDLASITLQGLAVDRGGAIGDYDLDGIPDLMVKFSREQLRDQLQAGTNTVVLAGVLKDGTEITGEGVIEIVTGGK